MTSSDERDEIMVGGLLAILFQEVRLRVDAELAAEGFDDYRPAHHPVFQWLGPDGDRVSDLARRAGVARQSMAELVDYLEAHGYLERVPDPADRRAVIVRRTERGWIVNRIARRVVEQTQAEWARTLGQEEFDQMLGRLRQLAVTTSRAPGIAGHPRTRHTGGTR